MNVSELETGAHPKSSPAHPIVGWLESRTSELLSEIFRQDFWRFVTSAASPPGDVAAVMREIYLEIVGYQPHVIEAAIASIAQMPRTMDPRIIKSMLLHQGDEFDHGEMALRDWVGAGGGEAIGRSSRMSPEAFAVAGVWWMIVKVRDPFAYLGALYLFEGLTPTVADLVRQNLKTRGLAKNLEYIEFHSTEDVKHANLVKHLISSVATTFPESVESIKHGFQCFKAVYPIPLWSAAYRRSLADASVDR
jgi:hypothetical protein